VYAHGDLRKGLETWLKMIKKKKVPVVLIDTVEKSKGWKLLKTGRRSRGILGARQIKEINEANEKKGIKTLWAGGISQAKAFEFGKLGVFGIYVTSAASAKIPVSVEYEDDPWLSAVKEPSYQGVYRTKLLLEAGFLCKRIVDMQVASNLENAAIMFVNAIESEVPEKDLTSLQKILSRLTEKAWKMPRKRK
jgi:hypothetical protein